MQKEIVNQVTNVTGLGVGIPELMQGIPQVILGDYVNGILNIVQGLCSIIGFYFVGK